MKDKVIKITRKNEQLCQRVDIDRLTGLFNQGGTKKHIDKLLKECATGVLVVLDVDYFKQVNDRYGHMVGDQLLKEIARIFKFMVLPEDIVGRIGGDEFVIFTQTSQNTQFAEQRCAQIQKRLKKIMVQKTYFKISVTLGYAICSQGDDYQSLFDRADQKLLQEKRNRNMPQQEGQAAMGIGLDVSHIQAQLAARDVFIGGYCQDYESFKIIYRFVKRFFLQIGGNVCTILFTLTDGNGDFPPLGEREQQMVILAGQIQNSLCGGDIFTQYSSGQFLVMLMDVSQDRAEQFVERITTAFDQAGAFQNEELLLNHSFPM